MKKKGFTLIELLAVIVILAIIALIAIPVITNVIEKAKKGAAESSALGYLSAVESQVAINAVDTSKEDIVDGEYEVSVLASKGVTVKGNGPKSGTVTITKGQVTACSLVIDKYTVTCLGNGKVQVGKEVEEEKLEGTEISAIAQSLLDNNTTYGNYTYMNGTYLKGVQENNYVWYNGFLWRIMGINENGTVRLITEENVTAISYGASGQGLLYATNEGYINDWLNKYFLSNLDSSKTDIITKSDWCLNTTTDSTSARQTCEGGTTFSDSVGLITLDEYNLSGASSTNKTYYLVNSQSYWTLTPDSTSDAWIATASGNAHRGVRCAFGVRPVINVSADAVITGGNGSLSDAYILNQTSESKTGKLNEKASSGEYVSLDGKTYRVATKESNGIKLIYDGYYEETPGTIYEMAYGTDNTFTTSSGIGQVLNGDVLTWLGNSDKIIESNWYQTSAGGTETKYTSILEDKTNPISAKVGLIRVGEMMSGQSASILTKNYTVRSEYSNSADYWTMNKYNSTSGAWDVNYYGYAFAFGVSSAFGVRPVIVVSTDTTISSGNGTLSSPYIIG